LYDGIGEQHPSIVLGGCDMTKSIPLLFLFAACTTSTSRESIGTLQAQTSSCEALGDEASCLQRSDCHPVYSTLITDPNVCGQTPCTRFKACIVGKTAECDIRKITCKTPPPSPYCADGYVPTVAYGCWGACVHQSECAQAPTYNECDALRAKIAEILSSATTCKTDADCIGGTEGLSNDDPLCGLGEASCPLYLNNHDSSTIGSLKKLYARSQCGAGLTCGSCKVPLVPATCNNGVCGPPR
jgi:hypothetical protein